MSRPASQSGPRTSTILVAMVAVLASIILCCCIVLFLERYRSAMIQNARTGSAQAVSQVSTTVGGYLRDMEQAMELIRDTDLTKMVNMIERTVLTEEECTSLDVAAALLKLAMGEENEDIIDCSRPARSLDDLDRYSRDGRRG